MIHRGPKNKTIHLLVSPELVTTCINSSASIKNEKHQTSSPSTVKIAFGIADRPKKKTKDLKRPITPPNITTSLILK